MSLASIVASVEKDFSDLEAWLKTESETAASDLLALGKHVAAAIEPALFAALQDGIAVVVAELGAGANFGQIMTAVLNKLEPEAQVLLRSVETNLLNGVASLIASKAAASAPAAVAA